MDYGQRLTVLADIDEIDHITMPYKKGNPLNSEKAVKIIKRYLNFNPAANVPNKNCDFCTLPDNALFDALVFIREELMNKTDLQ